MRPQTDHPSRRAVMPAFAALAVLLTTGCSSPKKSDPSKIRISDEQQLEADKLFVKQPFDDQAAQGVLRQRTIFEHEFEAGSTRLNAQGKRDLRMLAAAMREDGGSISIPRGSASADLYAARRESVRKALIAEGIAADRVRLDDAPPGGGGTPTVEALRIRERVQQSPMRPPPKDILSPTGGANP
ncbi:MAG: hypothetical protein ACKPEA_18260 [Planctomycetota bacterium]